MGKGRFHSSSTFSAHAPADLFEGTASCGSSSSLQKGVMNFKNAVDGNDFASAASEQSACLLKPNKSLHTPKARSTPKVKSVPSRHTCRRSTKPIPPGIDEKDLLAAIESLYQDRLKPFGRLVRKRLNERGIAIGLESGEAGLALLRSQCERSAWLTLESAQGGEWVVLLVSCKRDFVDFYSPVDIYPESLWISLSEYFEHVSDSDAVLPSGRFSCAQCLMDRRVPCLYGYALGSVCHIVQLMISQKKLLGYSREGITPYARSQSRLKDLAAKQKACLAGEDGAAELPFATWSIVRKSMIEALQGEDGPTTLPLSNIKRMFRTRFNTDLCETALGHSKVSELFQDRRLDGICTVKLLEQGYFIVPLFDKLPPSDEETEIPSDISCTPHSNSAPTPRSFSCEFSWAVRNTFVDTTPTRASLRKSKSLGELEVASLFFAQNFGAAAHQDRTNAHDMLPAAFKAHGFVIRNTFIETRSTLAGSHSHRRSQSA